MSIFNEFPYTNIHELNLDWLIKAVKEAVTTIEHIGDNWEEKVKEDVDQWLTDHPEATTTIPDGSITINKFSNPLKLMTMKDYVTPEMYGAIGDGVTDDTAAVQSAVNTGMPVALLNLYKVSQQITDVSRLFNLCDDRAGIIWADNIGGYSNLMTLSTTRPVYISDVILNFGTQNTLRHSITAENAAFVFMDNCVITGGYGYALKITGANNIYITNTDFKEITGASGNPGGAIYGQSFHDLIVTGCSFKNIDDHAVYCAGDASDIYNVAVANCVMYGVGRANLTNGAAIALYANTHDVSVSGCTIVSAKSAVYAGKYGANLNTPYDVTITGCTMRTMTENGILVDGLSGAKCVRITIDNCVLHSIAQDAIRLQHANHCNIANNAIFNATRYGIVVGEGVYNFINGNNIRNANDTGILIGYPNAADNNQICNNVVTTGSGTTGIYVRLSQANRLFNNYVNGYTTNFVTGGTDEMNIASSTYQKSIWFQTDPSAAQYHSVGDIVINASPSPGATAAWICTAAGSPGTLKAIATVAS